MTKVLPTSIDSSAEPVIHAALAARERAHAPFSKFRVGAALEDDMGRIFTGCNIENATYGLTMCAERVAVFKALSEGSSKIRRVVVVADTEVLTPPCGACRQILWEFCGQAELILANLAGKQEKLSLKEIFPRPFDASFL
ncbi:MAG: cytidine deaminase [Acidobacteriaceae bacterium]|nr:cytidine deaminase [Acidobacteriaceae bacterium]